MKVISRTISNNKLHSYDDKPSLVHEYNNGISPRYIIHYHKNGKYHRDNGPAIIYENMDDDGTIEITREEYYRNGRLHREDGPAIIYCYMSAGDIKNRVEIYYRHGKYADKTKPFDIRYANNIKILETYVNYPGSFLHKEDGPAFIHYNKSGKIIKKEYYMYGKDVTEIVLRYPEILVDAVARKILVG